MNQQIKVEDPLLTKTTAWDSCLILDGLKISQGICWHSFCRPTYWAPEEIWALEHLESNCPKISDWLI